jgi:hypothetical protein
MGEGFSIEAPFETIVGTAMPNFAPLRVHIPYRFYIRPDRHGHWIVLEHSNLAGGVFRSRDSASGFALSEAGGDAALVSVRRRSGGP